MTAERNEERGCRPKNNWSGVVWEAVVSGGERWGVSGE
jgi:hypothetical protein